MNEVHDQKGPSGYEINNRIKLCGIDTRREKYQRYNGWETEYDVYPFFLNKI
jgi:hypothetical protein